MATTSNSANMYIPSKIDMEYLIDAAEKTLFEDDIPRHIPFRLFKEAQKTLLLFGTAENTADFKDRIREGFLRLSDHNSEDAPIIPVLVEYYLEYNEKNKIDEVEGGSGKRERFVRTSKALRTALKMLTLVERGETSEEVFIREKGIPAEFLLDTEYDGRTNWLSIQDTEYDEDSNNIIESSSTAAATDIQASRVNANMDVPISKIDIEYLIDAAEIREISGFDHISYILYKEAQEMLEKFKNYQTVLIGPAENMEDLESSISFGLRLLTVLGKDPPDRYANKKTIGKLVLFYSEYKKRHLIDKLRKQDEKHKKWGTLNVNFQEYTFFEGETARREMALATSKVLRTALKALSRTSQEDTSIPKQFLQDTEYDDEGSNETYNIIPFDGRTNWLQAEVEEAIASLKLGIEDFPLDAQGRDVLECLQKFFKFQESSVSNQRENIVNLLSNEQMRLCTPGKHQTVFNEALENVFLKTLENYKKWCCYLPIEPIWNNMDENAAGEGENATGEDENAIGEDENVISNEKKILYISLYYLIWGEAANVRFLPECLCYIFHHMSKELDKYLIRKRDSSIEQVPQPLYERPFIDRVIQPLYEVIKAEAKIKKDNRDAPHSTWRNYDDFNEYFWSPDCFQLDWPLNLNSPFFQRPIEGSTVFGKTSFVERRTFLHLYHSFHRMWIFHVIMFEALVIFAFNDEKLNSIMLREILIVGPTYFLMKLIQSMLDIVLKDGAYPNPEHADNVSRIRFRIICFRALCLLSTLIIYFVGIFRKYLQEEISPVEESIAFYACIVVLVIYACTITWINQLEEYVVRRYVMDEELLDSYLKEEYVGRGMGEKRTDYIKYTIFWIVTLAINVAWTYYGLISPLVRPTRDIIDVSKNIHNMLAIGSLWAGVIGAYIVGSHVSYNVISAIVGTSVGHRDRLGKIKFLGDVHKCFHNIPTKFMDHLHIRESENNPEDVKTKIKLDAAKFSPFWNQIVVNLREEDCISDLEMYALSMPEKSGCIDVIQWPLFLLVGKVSGAIDIAEQGIPQEDMWDEISGDVYMKYAVEECFHSVKFILSSFLDDEGKKWVKRICNDIESSIRDGKFCSEFQLNKLDSFVNAISSFREILTIRDSNRFSLRRALMPKNIQDAQRKSELAEILKNVIQHDFLGQRTAPEQISNSDFNWSIDPELRSQIKRLHLLLTMQSAAHVPRNREARRRLEFFTNSLFMTIPITKPVREMLSFSVLTPYYEETVLYSLDELESSNDDGVTLIDYLKNLYPDEWTNYCERQKRYTEVKEGEYELRLWASYRGQTLARTVRGTMYYQKALLLQAYREILINEGLGVDGLPSTSPVPDVSMDVDTRAILDSLELRSSRGELLVQTSGITLRDQENYHPWREEMMGMLESENVKGFVDGLLRDSDPKGESQDEYVCNYSQKWKKLDKKVKDWIMASLNDILKNMVKKMKTAKELWETLEMFFSTDIISSVNVRDHVSISLLNKDQYRDWASQMEKFLQAKRMFCFTIGKFEYPDPKEESQEELVIRYCQQWKELNKQVKKWIRDSLSESMYDSVEDSETAKQMWDALKEIIGSQCLDKAKAHVDLKFTYVVSCQIYGKQKREGEDVAADIAFLLKKNDGLRVAFVDKNDSNEFYSKLVKADENGKEKEVYSIKLPGDPILGEGKPENQNHAIVFTRGNAIQTIDMNQDNYFEETLKMRNLLEEFRTEHAPTILGIREHIFTGSASSLASFMSNQETGFVTLGQRVMANPLKVRMHYGHPDVFDRVFHITRGGISKASRGINISEDIYAGFNSTLRQGSVTHHEYIQVGKGRDVGFNQIATFEGKVAGGNGEQVLSRDIYRLGQRFDFFRMLSFYYTTIGYYFSSLLMVITLYILLYGNLIMALSGTRVSHVLNDIDMAPEWFLMIVLLPAIYMILVPLLEKGLEKAVESFLAMFFSLCSIFYAFSLGTRIHWFGRTIIHGGASYQATGRGFVLHHINFSENFRRYSRSHFVKGMEVIFLVVVYCIYGFHSVRAIYNNLLLLDGFILSISWIIAPFLFDSSPFDLNKNLEDWEDWNDWRNLKSDEVEESWEAWWNKELDHIRTPEGRVIETILSLRFFIFPLVVGYKLDVQGLKNSLSNCVIPWICLVGILFAREIFSFFFIKKPVIQFFSNNRVATIGALAFVIAYYYDFGYMLAFTIPIITIVWGFISFFSNFGVGTIGPLVIVYYYSAFGSKLAFIIAIITTIWGFLSFFYNNPLAIIGALAIAYDSSALGDTLALFIAIITTVWGFLSICVAWKEIISLWTPLEYLAWICDTGKEALSFNINGDDDLGMLLLYFLIYVSDACEAWKPTLERFNLRRPVRGLAWFCDTGMGALMFKIANMFSQRSIKQYLVRNMFDQNISELLHNSSTDSAARYGAGF